MSFTDAARRVLAIAIGCSVAVLALCVPAAAAAAQVPPPTLTGESFAAGLFTAPAGLGSIAVTSATCNPAGSSVSATRSPVRPQVRIRAPSPRPAMSRWVRRTSPQGSRIQLP